MAAPVRQHTATTPGDAPTAADWNSLQDTFTEILNGTTLANYVIDVGSGVNLTLNNSGGGWVLDLLVSGTRTAGVNASGQWTSTLTTGTAPLKVASTTQVPNLNVASAGNASTSLGGSATALWALKTYVDAKVFTWYHNAYLGSSGQPDLRTYHVEPSSGSSRTWVNLRAVANGIPLGSITTTVRARHYNSSGTLQNTETVDITDKSTVYETAVNSGSGHALSDGDYILLDISSGGSYEKVIATVSGTETLQ